MNDRTSFVNVYVVTIALQFGAVLGSAIMIGCTKGVKYNKLVNPIIIFGPMLVAQWIIIRIGVLNGYFAPNALNDDSNIILNYFLTGGYIGIFGTVPELLLIGELLLGFIIDWIYWGFIEKRRRLLINETSAASIVDP